VSAVSQLRRLSGKNGNHAIHCGAPNVLPALQALGIKRHAPAVGPNDLAEITALPSQNLEIAREGIAAQTLLLLQGRLRMPHRMSVAPLQSISERRRKLGSRLDRTQHRRPQPGGGASGNAHDRPLRLHDDR
jgi:hypothetical protein